MISFPLYPALPSRMANKAEELWVDLEAQGDFGNALNSINESYLGEALLAKLGVDTLVYVGKPGAERAVNHVNSRKDGRAILFHPAAAVRKVMQENFSAHSQFKVCEDSGSIAEELCSLGDRTAALFVDPPLFDLDLVMDVSDAPPVKAVVGGYNSLLRPAREIFIALRGRGILVHLRDVATGQILHIPPDDQMDLSIIVPVFNIEPYIMQCLASLQDMGPLSAEIICVNDGSTDRSLQLVQQAADCNPNIKIIDQRNRGCAAARQAGLSIAKGRYIGFVDGDDWITQGMFQRLFFSGVANNADVVMGQYVEEYAETGSSVLVKENHPVTFSSGLGMDWIDAAKIIGDPPTIWRKIFRKSFLDFHHIEFRPDIPRFDDILFNAEVMFQNPRLLKVKGTRYHYRLQRPGQTVSFADERLFVHFLIFDKLYSLCLTKGDLQTETSFRTLQLASHYWADSLLTGELREEYRRRAAQNIFGKTMQLSPERIIEHAAAFSKEKRDFAVYLYNLYCKGI
jgi:glycosyltransferase involved in cell wall biosynthesis